MTTLSPPTIHDPATYWEAYHLGGEGRTRAGDYICYTKAGAPSNAAGSRPGRGRTEREALLNACYWSNQSPWVRVVPTSRAPRWAVEQAEQTG